MKGTDLNLFEDYYQIFDMWSIDTISRDYWRITGLRFIPDQPVCGWKPTKSLGLFSGWKDLTKLELKCMYWDRDKTGLHPNDRHWGGTEFDLSLPALQKYKTYNLELIADNCTQLRVLQFTWFPGCIFTNLHFKKLRVLTLCKSKHVIELSFLVRLQTLQVLTIRDSLVEDLSPLLSLPELRELNLEACENLQIAQLKHLSYCRCLVRVSLIRNRLFDEEPNCLEYLSDCNNIESITILNDSKIFNLDRIILIPTLKEIVLVNLDWESRQNKYLHRYIQNLLRRNRNIVIRVIDELEYTDYLGSEALLPYKCWTSYD